ncbi:MAG: DUF262 domain-containing protein, partial [Spirulina sp. DLM2.Bin59]
MPVGQNFSEQLNKVRVQKKIITRTVGDIVSDFQSAKIVIPAYQRSFVWPIDKQNRFIESIFMDVPIPPLFFLEKFDEEKELIVYEIIDGVQRLSTLCHFINGQLKPSGLENLPDLNQAKFQTLPANISQTFFTRELTSVIIESGTNPAIQFEVFGRLNMGSVSLNAQELRNCMFHGDFNDFLKDLNKYQIYRELLDPFPRLKPAKEGKPDQNRMFDVELILRFFTLHDLYNQETKQYPEPKGETLNEYMRKRISGDLSLSDLEQLDALFLKSLSIVKMVFRENHFKNFSINTTKCRATFSKQLNAAVFDVQMLGFIEYDISEIEGKSEVLYDTFIDLCSFDRDFSDALTKATNHRINERIRMWKQAIQSIMDNYDFHSKSFLKKKKLFENSPFCKNSGEKIATFEECDYDDGEIYHKCNSPKLEKRPISRPSVNSAVYISFEGEILEYQNIRDFAGFLIDYVSEKILASNDIHDIQRLQSLDFIGTQDELLSQVRSDRK